jgi:S-DNA-T family DNA segregation ATPase FtsK/SpoIIIE
MAEKKKSNPQALQDGKKNASSGNKNAKKKPPSKVEKPNNSKKMFLSIAPYVMLVIALVFALCIIIVQFVDEDGAGVVGFWINNLLCGLLGGAAFLLPIEMIYVNLRQILFNLRWKDCDRRHDSNTYFEYAKAKRRFTISSVMARVSVVVLAILLDVIIAANDSFDIVFMWEEGMELASGGIIGGIFGVLMMLAFKQVISIILLITILAVAVIFMLGLTPDYIIERIRENRERRREELAYMDAQIAAEEEARRQEEKKHAQKIASTPATSSKNNKKRMTDEEEFSDEEENSDKFNEDKPLSPVPPKFPMEKEPETYIGPSPEMAEAEARRRAEASHIADDILYRAEDDTQEEVKDFGGEEDFDRAEFTALDDFIKNAGLKSEASFVDTDTPIDMSQIDNEELLSDAAEVAPEESDGEEEEPEIVIPYTFPPIDLLNTNPDNDTEDYTEELQANARKLVETLKSFKVGIQEITYSRGPTITRYELKPQAGVKVRSIANLVDDIALNLATSGVRIEAPIPNKPAVGIEVPNQNRATVYLRDLIDNAKFKESKSKLTSSLGMDVGGNPIYFDIAKMPHLLIAGATGMGKSVCINSVIISILYKAKPEEVKLILIDPKKVEFAIYRDIPHLYAPIVSDPKKAAGALASAVAEMERRFELIEEVGVRDIKTYNEVTENDPAKEFMPHMVIIIDELADLMMTAPDEVESSICRLAQKARAAGIHIIIGTQRPSVDVITGLIKANIPSRIACTVASQVDSRTIIDIAGAEKLIGRGDMLFAPVGAAKPMRVQGAFVTEAEVENIVTFIKENNAKAKYNSDFINKIEEEAAKCGMGKKGGTMAEMPAGADDIEGGDSKFRDAVKLAIETGKISTSLMQRRLGVGYGRAAKIIDTMEQMGYVSRPDGNKPRNVLITMDEYMRRISEGTLGSTED